MQRRNQAGILGLALTAAIIVLFLAVARWHGVLPTIGIG